MKARLSVYLEPELMKQLQAYSDQRGKSQSLVAEAAIASLLSPDAAERQEAAVTRRLDRLSRQVERLERDLGISVEMLGLFVRAWLTSAPGPAPPDASARAQGRDRYLRFMEALGRRLAQGGSIRTEISY